MPRKKPPARGRLLSTLAFAAGGLLAAGEIAPPALNWVLPIFTDAEGHRSMTLRGSAVAPDADGAINITNLSITVFSEDAGARVDTLLLSREATFFPDEHRAVGSRGVRVLHDALEVTGFDWNYDHHGKKVSIRKDVRVVYRAPLKLPL